MLRTPGYFAASILLLATVGCSNQVPPEVVAPVKDTRATTDPAMETTKDDDEGGGAAAITSGPALGEEKANELPAADPAKITETAKPAEPQGIAVGEPHPQTPPPQVAGVDLISRATLYGNPDKASARLSPDGTRLSYLAPHNGVLNVFVGPADKPEEAQPVTNDNYRGIRAYFWAYDNEHLLYIQDKGGDEDFHVYSVDLAKKETKDLTPIDKVAAQVEGVSQKFPQEILIGINDRDPRYHDVYRVNIVTGERTLVQKNPDFAGFVTDDDYRVRFASKLLPDGSNQMYEPDGEGWKEFQKVPFEDTLTTNTVGFDKTGTILYVTDSRGRDTSALSQINLADGKETVLASNDQADAGGLLVHPTEKNIQAVSFDFERVKWQVLDPAIEPDLDYLAKVSPGEVQVASRTLDDKRWIVAYLLDDGPVNYYLYDRDAKQAKFLFSNRKALEGLPLAKMHPVVIKSRDGMNLVSYLTLPKASDPENTGRPNTPLPLVLLVHGGPWGRDTWGYDAEHQLLANRGYAVLSVNFRGSTGFGKQFTNAGDQQWAGTMHDDLIDAVNFAVAEKIADPAKVAIMGGSYGGYATLVGLTFTPDVFACGVDIVGPSNLVTLLSTIPPYWASALEMFKKRVGDPTTDEGKSLLNERSPLNFVEKIQKPLLIGQGANDPRVKQAEADQIVQAMQKKKIPMTYVLFPDEGHGFARPANNLAFYAVAEAFLARQLGGRYEPIGKDFAGSTITCPEGADGVPGLAAAIKEHDSQPAPEGAPSGA